MIVRRIRAVIPSIGFVLPELYSVNCFEFSDLLMRQYRVMVHALMLGVLIVLFLLIFLAFLFVILFHNLLISFFDPVIGNPLIISPIEWFVVYIIFVAIFLFLFRGVVI